MDTLYIISVAMALLVGFAAGSWHSSARLNLAISELRMRHESRVRDLHKEVAALSQESNRVAIAEKEMRRAQRMLLEREQAGDCFDELSMITVCANAYISEKSEKNLDSLFGAVQLARATLEMSEVQA